MRTKHTLLMIALALLLVGGSALAQQGENRVYLPVVIQPPTPAPVTATPVPPTPVPPTPVTPSPVTPVPLPDPVIALEMGTTTSANPCRVADPRPAPVTLPAGSTSFAFQITLRVPNSSRVSVSIDPGFGGGGTRGTNCNDYTVIGGRLYQNRLGAQVERLDGQPIPAGSYKLIITVDGTTTEVPFTVQ